ncbi:hypothetical protein KJZ67_01575 [Patescibacteria group bacterium]|nr:hypothetical protein [Patescibacteria group bacterium]
MKPDIHVCKNTCKIREICHPELRPETINVVGQRREITAKHEHAIGTFCRHYTCWAGGGEEAARKAMQGHPERFTVVERSGKRTRIRGWAFGTWEKPTANEKLRIVSSRGFVYSLQDGVYFATGQNVNR